MIEPGEIRLGDRAYGRYRDLAAVTAAGVDYVIRLSTRALKIGTPEGRPVNRAELYRKVESEGIQDMEVSLCGQKGSLPLQARLIILPLPPAQAAKARSVMRRNAPPMGL